MDQVSGVRVIGVLREQLDDGRDVARTSFTLPGEQQLRAGAVDPVEERQNVTHDAFPRPVLKRHADARAEHEISQSIDALV